MDYRGAEASFSMEVPQGKVGEPVDAALNFFLVSEEAKWVTGQVIHSNGGYS